MIIGYKNNAPQKIFIKRPCQGYYLRWYYNGWHYWFFLPGRLSLITEGEKYRTIGTKSVMMGTGQITYQQCQAIRTIMNTREVYILTSYGWRNVRIEPGSVNVYDNQVNGYEVELVVKIGSKEISVTGFSPIANVPIIPIPDPGLCEVVIGTQIWMCKNYDSNFPGSKVYNNDEANRTIYGGLYTYDQVISPGFCPYGWHVPALTDWQTLIDFVGDDTNAGGILKEVGTQHWNAGINGTDNYNFTALGSGYFYLPAYFAGIGLTTMFWMATEANTSEAYVVQMFYNRIDLVKWTNLKSHYFPVRLIKDTPSVPFNDYFLPSKDELNAIRTVLYLNSVGGFSNVPYWSSTEIDATTLSTYNFDTGVVFAGNKSGDARVRAIRSFVSAFSYSLQDIGPAGGYIFWKSSNNYLEAAPFDQSTSQQWSNITNALIGVTAQGTAIGTGQANTTAIINQVGHADSAAKLCDDLTIYH